MKKLLLSLGALSAVVAPVAAVVACGSTDSDSTSFEVATDAQATALHDLATTIQGHNSIIEDGATLTKTEVNGTTVRFTYTPATDTSPRLVTVSLDSKKITKVENELNGDLHDNTSSITDLDSINLSMHADFVAAATALEAVSTVATTGTAATDGLDKTDNAQLFKDLYAKYFAEGATDLNKVTFNLDENNNDRGARLATEDTKTAWTSLEKDFIDNFDKLIGLDISKIKTKGETIDLTKLAALIDNEKDASALAGWITEAPVADAEKEFAVKVGSNQDLFKETATQIAAILEDRDSNDIVSLPTKNNADKSTILWGVKILFRIARNA